MHRALSLPLKCYTLHFINKTSNTVLQPFQNHRLLNQSFGSPSHHWHHWSVSSTVINMLLNLLLCLHRLLHSATSCYVGHILYMCSTHTYSIYSIRRLCAVIFSVLPTGAGGVLVTSECNCSDSHRQWCNSIHSASQYIYLLTSAAAKHRLENH